jgi:uncharacterized GH25 family protein
MKPLVTLIALLCLTAFPAQSHEFWLSMRDYQVAPGQRIIGRLLVGSGMKGDTMLYLPEMFERFDIVEPGGTRPVKGRTGDNPAIDIPSGDEGLAVLVYESEISAVTYDEWETFVKYVTHKAFPGMPDAHLARGLPQTGFTESYRRYAKSLVAVGSGAGADRQVGMFIEIVAQANPYTDDLSGGLPLKVLLQGKPRAGVQLELFDTAPNGAISTVKYTTDGNGVAVVRVKPGHEYLADNVMLEALPNDNPAGGPVWRSFWASLTFQVPG